MKPCQTNSPKPKKLSHEILRVTKGVSYEDLRRQNYSQVVDLQRHALKLIEQLEATCK